MPLVPRVNVIHALDYVPDFQPTRASAQVEAWWRRSPAGVCCLVGLGGCGKTAVADHFLRSLGVLPGAVPLATRSLPEPLPRPRGVLVFSLAEGNPDTLFHELHLWITGGHDAAAGTSVPWEQLRRALTAAGQQGPEPILLVLDGMETVQSTGGLEGAGRVLDPRIRDLVTRTAYGAFPGVCLVATTRVAPVDVEVQRLPLYSRVEVEAMDPAAAAALLRARGLREDDGELRRIAERYGYHALTLDLVGSYVRQVGALPRSVPEAFMRLRASEEPDAGRVQTTLDRVVADAQAAVMAGGEPGTADTLLQLLSLFRRGVPEDDLFRELREVAGEDGDGPGVEGMDPPVARARLEQLARMRLVRRVEREGGDVVVSLHELVRDFVYEQIPSSRREQWHARLASRLLAAADSAQRDAGGGITAEVLDRLEEATHHQLRTDTPYDAFLTYWKRIGNYEFLGHLSSDYARGERLCRMLNLDHTPEEIAPYLHDGRGADAALLADWGLYLMQLGEPTRANRVFRSAHREAALRVNHSQLPIAARNLAESLLWRGELFNALVWAEEGERMASRLLALFEGFPTDEVIRGFEENLQTAAVALALRGEMDPAREAFEAIQALYRDTGGFQRVESLAHGRPWCTWLLLRGDTRQAQETAERELGRFVERHGEEETSADLREILARSFLELGQPDAAERQVEVLEQWAVAHDSLPHLCAALALRATISLARGDGEAAHAAASEGLGMARDAGLGLRHIDLLALQAEALLLLGDAEGALHAAATALFGQEPLEPGVPLYQAPARARADADGSAEPDTLAGIFPPEESGRPYLLAATHPDCGYAWGEAAARRMYGDALLHRLAIESARSEAAAGTLTPAAQVQLGRGRRELERSLALLEALVLPEEQAGSTRIAALRQRLRDLDAGVLTRYPVHADAGLGGAALAPAAGPPRVLVSYSHRDAEFARRLAQDLEESFPDVWIDQRRVHAGESFVGAINQALSTATDFVLIFSRAAARSRWVENELSAAIALRNQGRPLRIRPVVLDASELPPLLADLDVLSVESIGYPEVLQRLVASIGSAMPGSGAFRD